MQRALSAVLVLALAPCAAGHGWIAEPPARNAKGEERNGYCPQCGNGGSVCGDGGQWPASSNYLDGKGAGPQRTFTAGEVVEFTIKITAHHKGHMELHVCDETIGPQTRSPEGAQGCLNKWILQRVPPGEAHNDCKVNDARDSCQPLDTAYPERWYLSPGTGTKKMKFRIPQGLKCSSCTLQWRWWTANSCIPAAGYGCYFSKFQAAGWDKQAWCGSFCGSDSCSSLLETNTSRVQAHESLGCGEEFRNCADIAVLSSGGAPAPVAPEPVPAPAPTNPTKAPEQEPEPEPEAEEPEPEPEPATPAPSPQGCKAKPGNNGGATDAYCSKCATGYKWWPCNDQRLCEGAACIMSLAQGAVHQKASRQNRGFLATALIQAQTALGRAMGVLDAEEEL